MRTTTVYEIDDHIIRHHGVKGMKWGVRRTPAQLGRSVKGKLAKTKKNIKE